MIDPDLLRPYIDRFFGYGSLAAEYWFVGLEEGGTGHPNRLAKRVETWDRRGRPAVMEIREPLRDLGGISWFSEKSGLQRTWRPLIRTRFAAERLPVDTETARRYQIDELASETGDVALLELLPLPARGRSAAEPWSYDSVPLPQLSSRAEYAAAFTEPRRSHLLELISVHRPVAVVTYGDAPSWRKAFGANEPLNTKAWSGTYGDTIIVCTHHPEAARANAHWDQIGHFIAEAAHRRG